MYFFYFPIFGSKNFVIISSSGKRNIVGVTNPGSLCVRFSNSYEGLFNVKVWKLRREVLYYYCRWLIRLYFIYIAIGKRRSSPRWILNYIFRWIIICFWQVEKRAWRMFILNMSRGRTDVHFFFERKILRFKSKHLIELVREKHTNIRFGKTCKCM